MNVPSRVIAVSTDIGPVPAVAVALAQSPAAGDPMPEIRDDVRYAIEVITLAVTDVDRAKSFYVDQAGFTLDVDYAPTDSFRVVQLTPPASGCSIQFGIGLTDAPPGSARATYLAVTDLEAARRDLTERRVPVGPIRHKAPVDGWSGQWQPGIDPGHGDYASTAEFADPDGNTWLLQEIGFQG
jgi:catechol 2,3-dioxygenase-like lactoylglutathione lyase family enzyme